MGDEASRRMLLQKLKSRGVDSGESGEGFSGGAEIEEYIMNPKSGRLVLKTGKLGRKILVEQGGERKKRGRPRKPESEKKQKDLDKLKASPLNYGILKELIDKAQHGVTIEVKLADGTVLSISPEVKPLKAPNYGENF